jgi:penicillin-binding protein 2
MTPQLALRVAIVGSCALAMFAIVFFRLWFLQVLSGDRYLHEAQVNFVRDISVPAARGEILDRNGNILVESQPVSAVQISPPDLPVPVTLSNLVHQPAADLRLYHRLARVLGMPTKRVSCHIDMKRSQLAALGFHGRGNPRLAPIPCLMAQQVAQVPYAEVTIKTDVPKVVHYYLAENQNHYPGVLVRQIYLRTYPLGSVAAQLFGTVGPINPLQVKEKRYKGVSRQAIIGQSGLEYSYDQYLRGVDGAEKVRVNSLGQFQGYLKERQPVGGNSLKLSLDLPLQRAGEAALSQSIATNYPATGGAFVALDPSNGEVLAMGSAPTFNPSIFTHPISDAAYRALNNASSGYPLINRAIQSAGPTGSTFKVITAMAALSSGAWTTSETYDDSGQLCLAPTFCLHNAGGVANGVLDLVNAIRVSDDVFFYHLGALMNADPFTHPNGGALQTWARKLGIGQSPGVDVPGAVSGTLPTPKWRAGRNKLEQECDSATGPFKGHAKHTPGGCGIADGTNRPWSIGDNVNVAVGQGDVQVSPLQLAIVYSALENNGTVVRPHVGLDVQASDGTIEQRIDPPPARHVTFDPLYRQTILDGLKAAAATGTSGDVMGNFPKSVYGKTGTAQHNGQQDYAWYACFVPSWETNRPIVIVVTVEQGGFGDTAAAPVARQMLSQWFYGKRGQYVSGNSHTL